MKKEILPPRKKGAKKANALLDIDKITIDTGIADLASQHDHYLYGGNKEDVMSIVKEEAKKMIDRLPDTATWDDIMYGLYVNKKICASLRTAEEGSAVSHQDAKKRLLST